MSNSAAAFTQSLIASFYLNDLPLDPLCRRPVDVEPITIGRVRVKTYPPARKKIVFPEPPDDTVIPYFESPAARNEFLNRELRISEDLLNRGERESAYQHLFAVKAARCQDYLEEPDPVDEFMSRQLGILIERAYRGEIMEALYRMVAIRAVRGKDSVFDPLSDFMHREVVMLLKNKRLRRKEGAIKHFAVAWILGSELVGTLDTLERSNSAEFFSEVRRAVFSEILGDNA